VSRLGLLSLMKVSAPSSSKPRSNLPVPTTGSASLPALAKSILSQELQLYFTRLTTALIPPASPTSQAERHRLAGLASLRSDPGLGALIVYLVKWISESVAKCLVGSTAVLAALLDVIEALIENEGLFMEPYVSMESQLGLTSSCISFFRHSCLFS
jgi:transcription initiation factor TFIID subunit 6